MALKPNGTRRDDIELEHTAEWLAWVVEIRRHEDYGPVSTVRCDALTSVIDGSFAAPDPPPALAVL